MFPLYAYVSNLLLNLTNIWPLRWPAAKIPHFNHFLFYSKKKKTPKNYFFPVFHMSHRLVLLLYGVKAIKSHPFFAVPYSSILFYFPLCLSPAYSKQFATFQSYFIQKLLNSWPLLSYLCISAAVFCEMMIHLAMGAPG